MGASRALGALLLAAALGCAAAPEPAATAAPALLRVGTSGDYAPFSAGGEGFDVDAARLLASELRRELVLVPFAWPELAGRLARGDFDVAMSGVTWRPERALVGRMSLAVAAGGPCWLGANAPARVAVNRGGVLERFARARFPQAAISAVDDNRSLPARLARHEVDAIVTDSFEIAAFRAPGDAQHCEPPRDRKVYWIAPARALELGAPLDRFVRAREPELDALRARWFGAPQPRDAADALVDLSARRLAFAPFVAGAKAQLGQPIEDQAQEARVLESGERRARELGLEPASVRALFALQIELSKRVQRRAPVTAGFDLERQLRPALAELSARQLELLAEAAPVSAQALDAPSREPLAELLLPAEVEALAAALAAVARVP